jgi:hypothetical protein
MGNKSSQATCIHCNQDLLAIKKFHKNYHICVSRCCKQPVDYLKKTHKCSCTKCGLYTMEEVNYTNTEYNCQTCKMNIGKIKCASCDRLECPYNKSNMCLICYKTKELAKEDTKLTCCHCNKIYYWYSHTCTCRNCNKEYFHRSMADPLDDLDNGACSDCISKRKFCKYCKLMSFGDSKVHDCKCSKCPNVAKDVLIGYTGLCDACNLKRVNNHGSKKRIQYRHTTKSRSHRSLVNLNLGIVRLKVL